ncbi:MAG: PQQ-dependent sugar dehydrogenase [Pirellulaceae bacterium]
MIRSTQAPRPAARSQLLCVAVLLAVPLMAACAAYGADREDDTTTPRGEKPVIGLKQRQPWTASRITGTLVPPPPYVVERLAPELTFEQPVDITRAPGTDRLFVVEVGGKIFSIEPPTAENNPQPELMVDLATEVEGFYRAYGLTFHPNFRRNGICFVCYVQKQGIEDGTRVSQFRVDRQDPPRVLPDSEEILLTWPSGGHNGGCLKFGPDGYLYISAGDGGGSFPPDGFNTGQDIGDLRATVMRIDVDHPAAGKLYSVPRDNPFVQTDDARPEVWAYGFRNPWKMSFDPVTGALWVGDVGWEMWELVYRVEKAANYGWSLVEGSQPVHRERTRGPTAISPPTVEHSHTEARSITGGVVYHGQQHEKLRGAYIYGDYVTGKLWAARHDGVQTTSVEELADTTLQVISFEVDGQGELLILDYTGGVWTLKPNPESGANPDFPRKLSETGLFDSVAEHKPAAGVIPYSINAEMWTDGASTERLIAVPGLQQLGVYDKTNVQVGYIEGQWDFPIDTVLVKTISIEMEVGDPASRRRLETQILHRHGDAWEAYNYLWNDEQTDAELSPEDGFDKTLEIRDPAAVGGVRKQSWHLASRSECLLCHTTRAGSIHAFHPEQLDRTQDYGGGAADQLATLSHIGLFEQPVPQEHPLLVDPGDESADLESRARAYLHVNCAHCHRRGGGGSAAFDIRHEYTLKQANILEQRPTQGTFDIVGAEIMTPGDPYRSVLYYRMAKLGRGRMPHFGSSVVDVEGLDLMHQWLESLPLADDDPRRADRAARLRERQRAQLAQLVDAGDNPRPEEQTGAVVSQLLDSPSGGLMLLRAIDQQSLTGPMKDQAVALGVAHANAAVRDLFERFVPEQQRTKRLGTVVDVTALLKMEGDVARGKQLYFEATGVQCRNCHKIGGQGKEIGPELTTIARKNNRAQLLESILDPSRKIDPKYVVHLVETADGRVLSGLLVSRDNQKLVLRDAQDKLNEIAVADIEFTAPQRTSLMPELLLRDMTAQEVADLLDYLETLK